MGAGALLGVVVVDDCAAHRRVARAAVEAGADFEIVGEARNGKEAVTLVARLRPAVVLMDLELPVMSGIEAIERIMATHPMPILVYSTLIGGPTGPAAREALAAGAVDVLAKPGPNDRETLDEHAEQLRRRLKVAARVRVITHPRGRLRSQGLPLAGRPLAGALCASQPTAGSSPSPAWPVDGVKLVAIGASTGGPQALLTVLAALPDDLPQAVLVVQHMAEGFIAGLASWLDGLVAMPVVVGTGAGRLRPGTVTIAPSGSNLLVRDDRLRVGASPPEPGQHHVPGIDQCFTSIALTLGPDAVGVLLTGMGRDGAVGLKAMRDRGAPTLGQDEASSTVYGMPQAAFALGAVEQQVGVHDVAPAVLALLGRT